ncbi:MAG: hypothetical protein ACRD1N_03855 [Terriglobia bacterium]
MELKVGAAKIEITPPVGVGLSGFIARYERSNGVGDPLHARAVALSANGAKAAVLQFDLLGLAPWHVDAVREFAFERLGIPRDHVLLSATHTHSGPGVVAVRGCDVASYAYQREVVEKASSALLEASQRLSPATIETGSVPYMLGFNRREETANGVVLGFAREKPRPERLEVARLRSANQEALLFSHASHPYILGAESRLISGDFASHACLDLEQDRNTVALFLNGCAGNIRPETAFQGIEKTREEGKRMARAVRAASSALSAARPATALDGTWRRVHLPFAPLPRSAAEVDELARQQERVVRPEERGNAEVQRRMKGAVDEWAGFLKRSIALTWPIEPVVCEFQALRIGPLALAAVAGEPFFEIGESIRAASPFPVTWALGYTNAYCGYIPTRKEYPLGGYEVNDAFKYLGLWKIDENTEERVTQAARSALEELAGRVR